MKIAKPNSVLPQTEVLAILNNYYIVEDDYDFYGNNADDVTSEEILDIFNNNVNINYVQGWEKLINKNGKDYGYMRDYAKNYFVPSWSGLTFDDRKILIKYFIYPTDISLEEWNSYYSESVNFNNWQTLTQTTRDDVRLKRLYAAFARISYDCTTTQVAVIYLATKPYCIDYWMANLPHLILWITNGSFPALGIDFTTNGFAQMSGYSTDLKNKLLDILVNGNY